MAVQVTLDDDIAVVALFAQLLLKAKKFDLNPDSPDELYDCIFSLMYRAECITKGNQSIQKLFPAGISYTSFFVDSLPVSCKWATKCRMELLEKYDVFTNTDLMVNVMLCVTNALPALMQNQNGGNKASNLQ